MGTTPWEYTRFFLSHFLEGYAGSVLAKWSCQAWDWYLIDIFSSQNILFSAASILLKVHNQRHVPSQQQLLCVNDFSMQIAISSFFRCVTYIKKASVLKVFQISSLHYIHTLMPNFWKCLDLKMLNSICKLWTSRFEWFHCSMLKPAKYLMEKVYAIW